MRMYLLEPKHLCNTHLLRQETDAHTLLKELAEGKPLTDYVKRGLIEPLSLKRWHDKLVKEMLARGFKHNTVMTLQEFNEAMSKTSVFAKFAQVDKMQARINLQKKCGDCQKKMRGVKETKEQRLKKMVEVIQ